MVCCYLNAVIWAVGLAVITNYVIRAVRYFAGKYVSPPHDLAARFGEGSYAVVTGASDGMGKEFAIQLARRGFNVVIISRTKEKLESVAAQIKKERSSARVVVLVKDFATSKDANSYKDIEEAVKNLDLSILVNNVGVSWRGDSASQPLETIDSLVTVNCYATAILTRILLPQLLKRSKRSGIINLSSISGMTPMPFSTVYSATKVFDEFAALALGIEYSDKLDVMSAAPGYVSTPMTNNKKVSSETSSAAESVEAFLNDFGRLKRSYGSWKHEIPGLLLEILPSFLTANLLKKKNKPKPAEQKKND
jgi:17beta-estradiol 17-dehydrogenase / very-long-chain 3-oxoacyl-CoA reductase